MRIGAWVDWCVGGLVLSKLCHSPPHTPHSPSPIPHSPATPHSPLPRLLNVGKATKQQAQRSPEQRRIHGRVLVNLPQQVRRQRVWIPPLRPCLRPTAKPIAAVGRVAVTRRREAAVCLGGKRSPGCDGGACEGCMGVHGGARGCTAVHGGALGCTIMHETAWGCKQMHGSA